MMDIKKNLYTARLIVFLVAFFILSGCKDDQSRLFTRLSDSRTGINFKNLLQESADMNVMEYSYFYNGGGVAIGDVNNDGLQDVLFTGNMVKNRLYLNKGDLKFEDVTVQAGIASLQGWCTGASMVDINGDGNLDIYICRSADGDPERRRNLLYINHGNLQFTEEADKYGLGDRGYSTQAAFLDYDKDGDLDVFVINHSLQQYLAVLEQRPETRKQRDPNFSCTLYRNDKGKFTGVSDQAGIHSNVLTFALGVAVSDINMDGWPDLYVSNDYNEPDYLFINNKNGSFTERLSECMDHVSMYSMGSDVADFNNDGLPDVQTLDMLPESNELQKMHSGAENFNKMQMFFRNGFYFQFSRNMLQKNNGDGTFSEIGQIAGVSNTDWSWAALFSDFDNDGNKDLFVTNGYVKDYTNMDFLKFTADEAVRARSEGRTAGVTNQIKEMPEIVIPNYIYQNQGNGNFVTRTAEWGLGEKGISSGAAYADLDNDGDMELVVNNVNEYAGIYKNNSEFLFGNNYVKVNLKGAPGNLAGIGTKVTVYCGNRLYYQEQSPVRGFQSSVDPVLTFGIGKAAVIDSVVITWPDDRRQKIQNIQPNHTLAIKYSDAAAPVPLEEPAAAAMFIPATAPAFTHRENSYNDYDRQSLLPGYYSRQGPCMASADVNKDGREDLFIGGAKNQPGELFLQNSQGQFVNKRVIANDSLSENTAAEFFDADGDGDPDLYLSNGGSEFEENDPALQGRLLINDGSGNFSEKVNALPQFRISTGCVKAADVDGDGDLDLFVGGRLVPGKYPGIPESKILLNDSKGLFTDGTGQVSPALAHVGMVSDAAWVDMNNDKQPDLVIVGEWMPIKVFINNHGKLEDQSANYIHFASGGWWNRLLAEDMDGDGDTDLVIGNLGENIQFKASEKEPVSLCAADFDGNGSIDPILCYYIGGTAYPAAAMDDLLDQLPSLKKKFLKYDTYAKATINDLFTAEQLKGAHTLQAQLMKTVYLENTGKGGLVLHELPTEAQYAPVYAISAIDADHDGKKDLVLAGNNSWMRIKFGHLDANHGVLLLGKGNSAFEYVPQWKSGLNLRQNVRSMKAVKTKSYTQLVFGINDAPARSVQLK